MRLNEKTLKHSVGVAEFMADWAEKNYKYQFDPNEMYVLGLLHDIGKLYSGEPDPSGRAKYKGHAKKGGALLKELGFNHWREVAHHGHPEDEYWSIRLMVLNLADLSIDGNGEPCPITKRLASIKCRYGENSEEYQRATTIVDDLIKHGFVTLCSDGEIL